MKYIYPEEAWDYYTRFSKSLVLSPHLMAEDESRGIEIYMSSEESMNGFYPCISVSVDKEEVCKKTVYSREDTMTDVVEYLYENFLDKEEPEELEDKPKSAYEEHIDEIEEREMELDDAFTELLNVIGEYNPESETELVDLEELKERVLGFLYEAYGLSPYRPTVLYGSNGTETFLEYPYPEMDLDSVFESFNETLS